MKEFILLLPEIFLAATVLGIIISEIGYHGEKTRLLLATSLIGFGGAFVQALISYRFEATRIFNNAFVMDGLALYFKLFFILLAGLTVVGCFHSKEIFHERRAECAALIGGSAVAMCVAASSADFLIAFLALQLVNLLGYFLVAIARKAPSTEAAVKHLMFSAVAGVLFLFGAAILFIYTGTLNVYETHWVLMAHPLPPETALVAFMLIFLALCFQVAAFPMHLWAPDVIQGAPTPISGFLAMGTRAAGFVVAVRFFIALFSQPALAPGQWMELGQVGWPDIVAFVAGMTMLVGAFLAQRQVSAKRLVACLVVAETGFLLIGILVLDQVALAAILYTSVVQLFAWTGAFYLLGFFYDHLKSDQLVDLKGVLARASTECICLILCLVCAVGLPPFPGFLGKFALIGAALRHQWYFLAMLAIGTSAMTVVAVARLAYSLVGDFRRATETAKIIPSEPSRQLFLATVMVPMFLLAIFAELLLGWARQSLQMILW